MRKFDHGVFICSCSPWSSLCSSETQVVITILHQLTPDVSCSVITLWRVYMRTTVSNGNFNRPDVLDHFCLLIVAAGRLRECLPLSVADTEHHDDSCN